MPLIFMPRKSAFTWMLVMALICLIGGIINKEIKPAVIGAVVMIYAVISLATGRRKDQGEG